MKKQFFTIFLAIAIVAFAFNAFAVQGNGYGPGDGYSPKKGQGYGPGDGYGRGSCYMKNLSEDEMKKADEERKAFFKATEELRQEIYAKKLELKSEIAKKNTDIEKSKKIQNEISGLKAQFDQKRLEHKLKMKAINPTLIRGFGGRGHERMMNKPCMKNMNK
ncbi:MAG: periplasmic heavy metal sensor [Proteobacteria bacterium]|nr:periplasmic heavy metal sensor [Pseudomonadota bacterium]